MQIFIIIALFIAAIAIVFALQNFTPVLVNFLFWSTKDPLPLALVLFISVTGGVLISLLASLPGMIRRRMTIGSQKKKLAALEKERDDYKQRAETAEKDLKPMEDQVASLSAELDRMQMSMSADKSPFVEENPSL
jgi:lipopolysaccharide assembly protein A